MIVLDASVAIDFLLDIGPYSARVAARMAEEAPALAAPHLLDVEVTQVLRRFVLRGAITQERARGAVEDLADLPVIRYPHTPLLSRMFALRDNLTAYDAAYLVLAESLGATLLTKDGALASIPGASASVELIRS